MKKYLLLSCLSILSMISFTSCLQDECDAVQTFIQYDPVFMTEAQIRQPITFQSPRELEHPGKLYVYGQYLLINELREGIHFFDNSDPKNPVNLGFIKIPGNIDMAVKSNILYADNYMDLVALDISQPTEVREVYRDQDVFNGFYPIDNRGRLVYHEATEITRDIDCTSNQWGNFWFVDENVLFAEVDMVRNTTLGGGGTIPATGVGGSMARFTIAKDHLYTIDVSDLYAYNITQAAAPTKGSETPVGWNIETIFPANDHLFIGSNTGMFIYDISNPTQPFYRSQFNHAQACDPVFVQGDKAYVTLRGGTICQNFTNQLDILDISDLNQPRLLATHQMSHPHGLHVWEDELILCEGKFGWKSFELEGETDIQIRHHEKQPHSFDVIRLSKAHLLLVGEGGLYQYDISNPDKPQLLSAIQSQP